MPDEKDFVLMEVNAKVNHPEIVADIFNKHYKSIISNKFLIIANIFAKCSTYSNININTADENLEKFTCVSDEKVVEVVNKFKPKKSTGPDGASVHNKKMYRLHQKTTYQYYKSFAGLWGFP